MLRHPSILVAILALLGAASAADAVCTAGVPNANLAESTPTSAFTFHGDGTLTHNPTGLMWKQCAQGASGPSCGGTALALTWRAALAAAVADTTAGHTDWRLPNAKELDAIVELCGYGPAINQAAFPATAPAAYWSATTHASSPAYAWNTSFQTGQFGARTKAGTAYARLVRGGLASAAFDARVTQVVVEYLDTADFPGAPGGHYFYSSDRAEQAALDAGAAGQFARTGRQFLTGGSAPVCRFYGSMQPGPNSHFFTVDTAECNALIAAQVTPKPVNVQQWNYEGVSYATTPVQVAANGVRSCPAGTLPLYRAYNNAYSPVGAKNPWDSNHRFTPQAADIPAMVAAGWRDEGIVFCTA